MPLEQHAFQQAPFYPDRCDVLTEVDGRRRRCCKPPHEHADLPAAPEKGAWDWCGKQERAPSARSPEEERAHFCALVVGYAHAHGSAPACHRADTAFRAAESLGRERGIEEAARHTRAIETNSVRLLAKEIKRANAAEAHLDELYDTLRGLAVSAVNGDYDAEKMCTRLIEESDRIDALLPGNAAPQETPETCPEEGCVLEADHKEPCDTEILEPAERRERCSRCCGTGQITDYKTASIRTDTVPPQISCPDCSDSTRFGTPGCSGGYTESR